MRKGVFLLCVLVLMITGCGTNQSKEETVTLVLGMLNENPKVEMVVDQFNKSHENIKIEVKLYQEEIIPMDGGYTALAMDIAAGTGPDIIDFGAYYTPSMTATGITADLYPFFQGEEELTKNYFVNIIDAMAEGDKLAVISPSFSIRSLVGRGDVLGDKTRWSMEEMTKFYEKYPQGTVLFPGDSKWEVFGALYSRSVERFIDWGKGQSSFSSMEFQRILKFANQFPEIRYYEDNFSWREMYETGEALLYPCRIDSVYETALSRELFLDEAITFIGYPTEEGNGNVIAPGEIVLSISETSAHKMEAWEFIQLFLTKEYQCGIEEGLPVSRKALQQLVEEAMEVELEKDLSGDMIEKVKGTMYIDGEEPIEVSHITEVDAEKLFEVIETADQVELQDSSLSNIICEEAGYYFDGVKSAEEVSKIMENRANIYIRERME